LSGNGTDSSSSGTGSSSSGTGSSTTGPGDDDPATGDGTSAGGQLPWFATPSDPAVAGDPADGRGGASTAARSPLDGPDDWFGGPFEAGLASLGISGPGRLATIPAAVGSTIAVTTWMAFMLFSKRRRDNESVAPDDVLQASAAMGFATTAVAIPVAPMDPESSMPRWRRPSLLEARRTDPIRSPAAPRPRLAFGSGPGELAARSERRVVRYAFSPLLDRPDEIRAEQVGELVTGDEVEIRERSGAYCLVLCPDGREGWVHRMTLGDSAASAAAIWGVDAGIEPEAENALAALLAARGMR
jgi:hypothetical protein